ncbi:MAG: ribosome-binding factor A [Parcubacteria group bacterium Licking1014_1]|nr:MAG: ribosome-binding factor A [Parcubacteria group bacterium Licking1014_1]
MINRIQKVNSLLKREISKILLRDFDFSFEILVTLTRVEATPNLIEAKTYISVFPDKEADKIIAILNKNVFGIQQKINKILKMRPIPKIKFIKEKNISEASKIEELLNKIKDNSPVGGNN